MDYGSQQQARPSLPRALRLATATLASLATTPSLLAFEVKFRRSKVRAQQAIPNKSKGSQICAAFLGHVRDPLSPSSRQQQLASHLQCNTSWFCSKLLSRGGCLCSVTEHGIPLRNNHQILPCATCVFIPRRILGGGLKAVT